MKEQKIEITLDEYKELLELTIQFVEEELDKGTPKKDIIKAYSTQVGEAFNHIKHYITNLQQIEQDHQKLNGELREENKKLQEENERLNKALLDIKEYIEDRISVLTISVDNKAKDEYFNNKCIGGVQELKHLLDIVNKALGDDKDENKNN